jgi:nitrite reductase/ring-hydroxylating ferredoxin subunit
LSKAEPPLLGPFGDCPPDRVVKLLVEEGTAQVVALRRGEALFAYRNVCPHLGLPLDDARDAILSADCQRFVCSAHNAAFSVETGRAVHGLPPDCVLTPVPLRITVDGEILTG